MDVEQSTSRRPSPVLNDIVGGRYMTQAFWPSHYMSGSSVNSGYSDTTQVVDQALSVIKWHCFCVSTLVLDQTFTLCYMTQAVGLAMI